MALSKLNSILEKDTNRSGKTTNIAFEIIHSFDPEESKRLSAKEINLMGVELAKSNYPNHEFFVVTHTDTAKTHNHIMINPVNELSGKRDIIDKKSVLEDVRTFANDISRENGLSVIRKTQQEKERNLPNEVREINRRGGKSQRMDLFQKADLAREYATDFDTYVSTLSKLGVQTAITEKTISYFYGDRQKGIRGKGLGALYDKAGLIEKFKDNDEKFKLRPNERRKIRDGINDIESGKRDIVGVSSSLLLDGGTKQAGKDKDYSSFTKSNRRGDKFPVTPDNQLLHSLLPISELTKASKADIFEYCNKNKIKTFVNEKGQRVLKGKEFVVIDGSGWKNTKNKTHGSLIDIVAYHKDISFLSAVSQITGNKNLLLLEKYNGEVKRPYTSFYIPKEKSANLTYASKKLTNYLKYSGINSEISKDLFRMKKVQVDKKGDLWFFSENGEKGALQISGNEKQGYKSQKHGDLSALFWETKKKSKNVTVYTDPFTYLKNKGRNALERNSNKQEAVFLDFSEKSIDVFLSNNPQVCSLDIITTEKEKQKNRELSLMKNLKSKYQSFSISIEQGAPDRGRSGPSFGLEIDF